MAESERCPELTTPPFDHKSAWPMYSASLDIVRWSLKATNIAGHAPFTVPHRREADPLQRTSTRTRTTPLGQAQRSREEPCPLNPQSAISNPQFTLTPQLL